MGHTLWINFPQPSAGAIPKLSCVLRRAIEVANNHLLALAEDDLAVGLCVYDSDPRRLSRGAFDVVDLRGDADWPDVVRAFFVSDEHGFAETSRHVASHGGRYCELQLRIRGRSPTPLCIGVAHSFATFAARQLFVVDPPSGEGGGFRPDPRAKNHVYFGVKAKSLPLPEDYMLAFCFLESFAALVPPADDHDRPRIHSEMAGALGEDLQIRSLTSVPTRWEWSWKMANHHSVLAALHVTPGCVRTSMSLFSFLRDNPVIDLGLPEEAIRRFGICIDVNEISSFDYKEEDKESANYLQHRLGPLLLDDITRRLFGSDALKSRHKCLKRVQFKACHRVCNGCGRPENSNVDQFMLCARCSQACYCGRDCQVRDWKGHKKTCSPVEALFFRVGIPAFPDYVRPVESLKHAPAMKLDRPLRETVIFLARMAAQVYNRTLMDQLKRNQDDCLRLGRSGAVVIPAITLFSVNRRGRYVVACAPWILSNCTVDNVDQMLRELPTRPECIPKEKIELATCYWHAGRHLYHQVYRSSDDCNFVIRCQIHKKTGLLDETWTKTGVAPLLDLRRVLPLLKQ